MRTLFLAAALWIFMGWPASAGAQRPVGNNMTAAVAVDVSSVRAPATPGVGPQVGAVRMAAFRFSPMPGLADAARQGLVWTVQGNYCRACRRKCTVFICVSCIPKIN